MSHSVLPESRKCCIYCQSELVGVFAQCSQCKHFDLCLKCFSCSAELGSHKKDHDYNIISGGAIPIFDADDLWTSTEESRLLEAVELCGFGNWEDVAKHIKSKSIDGSCLQKKSSESRQSTPCNAAPPFLLDCKTHYFTYYVDGAIGKATLSFASEERIHDHTCTPTGSLSPGLTVPLPPIEMSSEEQKALAYMPYRNDFEREFDNEAECLLSNLSAASEQDDVETALKLVHIDIYRRRLRERERRKRIAREYGLIATALINRNHEKGRRKSRTDKIFSQFIPSSELEKLIDGIKKEKHLKSEINELCMHRVDGLKKRPEFVPSENDRPKKEHRRRTSVSMDTLSTPQRGVQSCGSTPRKSHSPIQPELLEDLDDEEERSRNGFLPPRRFCQLPGYNLLLENEKKLCSSLRMRPAVYLTLKTVLIEDDLLRKKGIPVKTKFPSGISKGIRRRIESFLTRNGWLGVS